MKDMNLLDKATSLVSKIENGTELCQNAFKFGKNMFLLLLQLLFTVTLIIITHVLYNAFIL